MAISIAGLLALWRLWGTPYNIIWWAVLILMILGWITAQIKRTSAKGESEQEVTGFWSCANKGILVICLILAVVGIVLVYAVHLPHKGEIADQSQVDPRSRAVESDDRRFCRTAMISFIKAQGMQWDADGNYVETETKLKHTLTYEWQHTISDVLNAIITSGLIILEVNEYPFMPWKPFPMAKKDEEDNWQLEGDPLPLCWSVKASKP